MTPDQAEVYGRSDGQSALTWAAIEAPALAPDGSACIADGSNLSPAWRVLPHGEHVFQCSYEDDGLIEAYEHGLDKTIEASDLSLSWSDGMLFLYGEDFDHDAAA